MISDEASLSTRYERAVGNLAAFANPGSDCMVRAQSKDVQFVSVVSIGELRRGATLLVPGSVRRTQLEQYIEVKLPILFATRVIPVTQAIAERWGVLDALRQAAGQPLGMADGMIAATAFEHDLTLVTRNVKDFAGLGIAIINPWD